MKIYEFKGKSLSNWIPKCINRNGKVHHNLRIGDYNKECWEYMIGIDDSIVELDKPPVPMEDEYFLVPLQSKDKDTEFLEDKEGNALYYIKEVVGRCYEHTCLLGLTLTSKSVLDVTILDDTNITRVGAYRQRFLEIKEMFVYMFKPDDILTFRVVTKTGTITYKITMVREKLVLTEEP